jgi:hypothetical protein
MATQTLPGRVAQFGLQKNASGGYLASGSYPTWNTSTKADTTQGTSSGYWIKWRQGSMLTPKMDYAFEFEGDGSRGESLGYRKLNYGQAKHIFAPRAVEIPLYLTAFAGTGSDTVVSNANVLSATGTAAVTANTVASVPLTGTVSGTIYPGMSVQVDTGGSQETVIVLQVSGPSAPATTGTTITAFFTKGHTTSYAINGVIGASNYAHVVQPALTGNNDFYDLVEQYPSALPIGTNNKSYIKRMHNSMLYSLGVNCSTQSPVMTFEADWYGINNQASDPVNGETAMSTGSAAPLGFQSDQPYYLYTASQVAFPATSLTAAVKDVAMKMSFELTPSDFQTDAVTPLPYVAGNLTVSGDVSVLWQDGGMGAFTYFGSSSGTADSTQNITGSMGLVLQNGSTPGYTFGLVYPACAFQSSEFTPDLSGKPLEMKLSFHALKYTNNGAGSTAQVPIFSACAINGVSAAY